MSKLTVDEFQRKAESTVEHLKEELKKIRGGRANPSLVEDIEVEAYGQRQPLRNLANINVVDAGLITVQPWDRSLNETILKAIQEANMGINPMPSADVIRLPLPPLTEERRKEFVKMMKERLEESKIAVRVLRKDVLNNLDDQKKDGTLSEDQYNSLTKKLQNDVDSINRQIEDIGSKKEKDLLEV